MRIISEDRETDVPYEQYIICLDECSEKEGCYCITAQRSGDEQLTYVLAETEHYKMARAAMEKIQEAYHDGAKIIWMDVIMEEVRSEC